MLLNLLTLGLCLRINDSGLFAWISPTALSRICFNIPSTSVFPHSGVHHKGKGKKCDPAPKVTQIKNLLAINREKLFPDGLVVAGNPRTPNRMPKPNGGWGDSRDRQLCASFATVNRYR